MKLGEAGGGGVNQGDVLVLAILRDRSDVVARLAYADWLEECYEHKDAGAAARGHRWAALYLKWPLEQSGECRWYGGTRYRAPGGHADTLPPVMISNYEGEKFGSLFEAFAWLGDQLELPEVKEALAAEAAAEEKFRKRCRKVSP